MLVFILYVDATTNALPSRAVRRPRPAQSLNPFPPEPLALSSHPLAGNLFCQTRQQEMQQQVLLGERILERLFPDLKASKAKTHQLFHVCRIDLSNIRQSCYVSPPLAGESTAPPKSSRAVFPAERVDVGQPKVTPPACSSILPNLAIPPTTCSVLSPRRPCRPRTVPPFPSPLSPSHWIWAIPPTPKINNIVQYPPIHPLPPFFVPLKPAIPLTTKNLLPRPPPWFFAPSPARRSTTAARRAHLARPSLRASRSEPGGPRTPTTTPPSAERCWTSRRRR